MRIGVDARHLANTPLTGVDVVTRELIPALAGVSRNDEIRVFYNGLKPMPKFVSDWNNSISNITVLAHKFPNRLFDLGAILANVPKIDNMLGGIDVLFSPHALLAPLKSAPRVIVLHDLSFVVHPEYYSPRSRAWHVRMGMRTQANNADMIIVPSKATARDVVRLWNMPREKVCVVEWGTPTVGDNIDSNHTHKQARTILCLGTIGRRKNQRILVEALAYLHRDPKFQDVRLCLVGDLEWGSDEVISKIKEQSAKVRDAIRVTGYVNEKEKRRLLAESSVFVYPSLYEGAALPPLEAMQAGVPVIASRLTAIPETVGSAALLLDPSSPHAIAQAIKRVLSDDALRDKLIRRGIKQAEQFTWNKAGEKVSEILQKVVEAKKLT